MKGEVMRFCGYQFDLRKAGRITTLLAALTALAAVASMFAGAAAAGRPIADPSALQPAPPPGAVCRADGPYVICDTFLDATFENEPVFDLPCGTVYETSADNRDGTRWYVDNLLVKRRVVAHLTGTWSLSPTGGGPTVVVDANWNWWIRLAVPGDESTGELTSHGTDLRVSGPGLGGLIHDAGITYPDGTHHGIARFFDTPGAAVALCAALGA
jgi:hypothetical protein